MNQTIAYRRGFAAAHLTLCTLLLVLELAGVFFAGFSPLGFLLFLTILCTVGRAVHLIRRIVLRTGCFSIRPEGLVNASIPLLFGPLKIPFTVALIPWRCIRQFRCDRGRVTEILLVAAEKNEFPPNYPPFAHWILSTGTERLGGVPLGVRWANCDPDKLTETLESARKRAGSPRIVSEDASFFAPKDETERLHKFP